MDTKNTKTNGPRVFHWQGTLPPALMLLLIAPLLLVFLSFAALLVAGGTLAAVFLPFFFRSRLRGSPQDPRVITLEPDQYSSIERDTRQLPPR